MNSGFSNAIYVLFLEAKKNADIALAKNDLINAKKYYLIASDRMRKYSEYAPNSTIANNRIEKAQKYEKKALSITDKKNLSIINNIEKKKNIEINNQKKDDYEEIISQMITVSNIKWDDIAGLDDIKSKVRASYAIAFADFPDGVKYKKGGNILLYGPPGTGKSLLAAAIAGSLEATFYNVNISNLLSKFFGESPKLISALYDHARNNSPSVIFIDEFEALLGSSNNVDSGPEVRVRSTLLAEIDGMKSKSSNEFVLTLGATNNPWFLGDAVLSRFPNKVYVGLPDFITRKKLFENFIINNGFSYESDFLYLIERSEKYSGREIEQICQIAITNMIERLNPKLLENANHSLNKIKDYKIILGDILKSEFDNAFIEILPVTNETDLIKFESWIKNIQS